MRLSQDHNSARFQIRRLDDTGIYINETHYTDSLVVSAEHLIAHWPVANLQALTKQHFLEIFALKPELILLGTGSRFQVPSATQRGFLEEANIAYEFMETTAAARTFIALAAEGRLVVAALIIEKT